MRDSSFAITARISTARIALRWTIVALLFANTAKKARSIIETWKNLSQPEEKMTDNIDKFCIKKCPLKGACKDMPLPCPQTDDEENTLQELEEDIDIS